MKKNLFRTIMVVLILMLTACGSSTQKVETMPTSEAAVSPTEPALPSYELKVMVADQDGSPISWSTGIIQISGKDVSMEADDSGQIAWNNLAGATGTLTVSAQGYKPTQQSLSLVQGSNELSVKMEIDPLQLNPAKVCSPDQKIIYVEDFEDGQAQYMENLVEPKWDLVSLEDNGMVLSANSPGGSAEAMVNSVFSNAVWLFDIKTSGVIDVDFLWHVSEVDEGPTAGLYRYNIAYQPGEILELDFERPGEKGKLVESESPVMEEDAWRTFAIAYYNGGISIWVDGEKAMNVEHVPPIEKGIFGFQVNPGTEAEIFFDNIIVCGLNEPYTPPAVAP